MTTDEYTSTAGTYGEFTLSVPQLDALSCTKIRLNVRDADGALMMQQELKVPIMVTANATTADATYFDYPEFTCKQCDVVVRDGATLTKAAEGTTDDRAEVQHLFLYPGASLVVPTGTNYSVASLTMRAMNDVVSKAYIEGDLSTTMLYHDRRMDGLRYYFFTLPYDCDVLDMSYSNGKALGTRGVDWEVKYYDGASRVVNLGNSSNWRAYEGATLKAGAGYVIAIDASGTETKEVRFPMSYAAESATKQIEVDDHGITTAVAPNHKGWNLIGNPYMSGYSATPTAGLVVGALEMNANGEYELNTTLGVPYVTIPVNGGVTYTQIRASDLPLDPFTSFFVQVAGSDPEVDESDLVVQFSSTERQLAPATDAVVDEQALWVPLILTQGNEQDVTTIVLRNDYQSHYEIGLDLEKMMGYSTKPQLYSLTTDDRLAFNALPDSLAQQIPMGYYAAADGPCVIAVNRGEDLSQITSIWLTDKVENKHVNLLQGDYPFTTAKGDCTTRFLLSIDVARKSSTTVDSTEVTDLYVTSSALTLTVHQLPEKGQITVLDVLGRCVTQAEISANQMQFALPEAGIYFVRVVSGSDDMMVKCIVK